MINYDPNHFEDNSSTLTKPVVLPIKYPTKLTSISRLASNEINRTINSLTLENVTLTTFQSSQKKIDKKVIRNQKGPKTELFWMLARWEGQILSIEKEILHVILYDQKDSTLIERAEIPKDEISPADHHLIRPGAVFYWYVGYYDKSNGQRVRESIFWFRRGGKITEEQYNKNLQEVNELWDAIEWEQT